MSYVGYTKGRCPMWGILKMFYVGYTKGRCPTCMWGILKVGVLCGVY